MNLLAGNVRCAPGCFSLFRASALHENASTDQSLPSVIDMYSTVTKRWVSKQVLIGSMPTNQRP